MSENANAAVHPLGRADTGSVQLSHIFESGYPVELESNLVRIYIHRLRDGLHGGQHLHAVRGKLYGGAGILCCVYSLLLGMLCLHKGDPGKYREEGKCWGYHEESDKFL